MNNATKYMADLYSLLANYVAEPNDPITRGGIRNTIHQYLNSKLPVTDITTVENIDGNICRYRIMDFAGNVYELTLLPGKH